MPPELRPNIPSMPTPPPRPNRTATITIAILGVLIVLMAALLVYVLVKPKTPGSPTSSTSPSPTSAVVADVASKQPGVNVVFDQPTRSGDVTRIDFALHNTTDQKLFTGLDDAFDFGTRYPQAVTYLLNPATSANYGPVLTSSGSLQTCGVTSAYVAAGEELRCYYEFTGVPAGTKVSLVTGAFRLDGLLVP